MGALTRNGLSSKWHNKSNYTIKIEAATGGALCKKVFVKNSQENTCAKVSFLIKLKASACNLRARSLVVSDLRSETKGSRFESGCQLCAEVSSLQ